MQASYNGTHLESTKLKLSLTTALDLGPRLHWPKAHVPRTPKPDTSNPWAKLYPEAWSRYSTRTPEFLQNAFLSMCRIHHYYKETENTILMENRSLHLFSLRSLRPLVSRAQQWQARSSPPAAVKGFDLSWRSRGGLVQMRNPVVPLLDISYTHGMHHEHIQIYVSILAQN